MSLSQQFLVRMQSPSLPLTMFRISGVMQVSIFWEIEHAVQKARPAARNHHKEDAGENL